MLVNNFRLNVVKKELGTQCTFLSFATNERYYDEETLSYKIAPKAIKAVLKNDFKGKDTIVVPLEKDFDKLIEDDFKQLFFGLNSRQYEQRSGDSV